MKTISLNKREKNIGVLVLALSLVIISWGRTSRQKRENDRLKDEISALEEKFNQSKTTLEQAMAAAAAARPKVVVPESNAPAAVDKKATLYILRDLTAADISDKVRIVSAERHGQDGYTITVEGEFIGLMRFMSFLERREGKFLLERASIYKAQENVAPANSTVQIAKNSTPTRKVQGVFQLGMKG